jgi:MFS transporter, Spinster family, sphingosine-1-phosphate transporter
MVPVMNPAAPADGAPATRFSGIDRAAWTLLAGLTALNVLNFVDRQLVVTLAPLLMADLGLSRARIGLLIGVSFIAVFALSTQLAGAAADRARRPRLIAAGLALWSLGTALSATAQAFWHLALLRGLIGIGESVLVPASVSMLGDRFPRERFGLASGVLYAGVPVGFALSFALAGFIGPWLGWRACFLVLGGLGLVAVPAVLRLPEPPRETRLTIGGGAMTSGEHARALAHAILERPAIVLVSLAGAAFGFASGASQHTITWLVLERGLPYARAAFLSAAVLAPAGLAGSLAIGTLTDRFRRAHLGGRLPTLAILALVGLGAAAAFYLLPASAALFLPAWFLAQAFLMGWFGALVATLDELAPPALRASVVGFGLLVTNLIGVALGPWVTGLVGDRLGLGHGLLLSVAAGVLGVLLLIAADRKLSDATVLSPGAVTPA